MSIAITEGIEIKVTTRFRPDLSQPETGSSYFYNYHVTLENHNPFDVKLLHRDWYIFDSLNEPYLVSGPGVIGEQPILKTNEKFDYTSGCEIKSEIGAMSGHYTFMNLKTGMHFQVLIPSFELSFPPKLN